MTRIDDLLGNIDGFDRATIASLDATDIEDARRRALDSNDPKQVRALQILARVDAGSALTTATQLLAAGGDGAVLGAAIGAAAAAGPLAVPLATGAAIDPDPAIALAAWMTLQQIASSDDLPALDLLAQQTSGVVLDQALFALSVIAYRAGESGFELPVPSRLLDVDIMLPLLSINTAPADDDDFALLADLSSAELYKVALRQDATTAIDCDEDHMLLAFDSDIFDALPDTLVQSPALAGLVALRDRFGEYYSVRYLVLTWPDDRGGFHVGVHQSGGAQIHFGTAEMGDREANLTLRSVERPGAVPIQVSAAISEAGVAFGEAFSSELVAFSTPKIVLDVDA